MEQFYSLLCCWGRYSFEDSRMDIIASLPLELAIMILRSLEPKALLAALSVSRKWLRVVRSDSVLRSRVRDQLLAERQELKNRVTWGCLGRSRVATGKGAKAFAKKNKNTTAVKEDIWGASSNVLRSTNIRSQNRPVNVSSARLECVTEFPRRIQPYPSRQETKTRRIKKTLNLRL